MNTKVIATVFVILLTFGLAAPVRPAPKQDSVTVVLEGEAATTASASSDPNENETNGTSGWTASGAGSSVASVTSPYVGTYAVEYTSNGASNRAERTWSTTAGKWYQISMAVKDTTGNTGVIKTWVNITPNVPTYNVTTSYTTFLTVQRATTTLGYARIWNETVGNKTLIDNFSIRPITTSSLFSGLQTRTANAYVSANWNVANYTQAGVVAGLDSASTPLYFVIAYYDKNTGRIYMDKCLNGTYTNLIATTTAYVVGATVQIRRTGTTYQVFYNGTQVGADQTVDDAGMGFLYGAFSTYSSNTYTGLTFTENSTATPTITNTYTPTLTFTPTFTRTFTPTETHTFTPLPSHTFTPTFTFTPTETFTPTFTFTPSLTPTPGGPAEISTSLTYGDMAVLAVLAALLLAFVIYGLIRWFQGYFDRKR
jgi:hypothetical protein